MIDICPVNKIQGDTVVSWMNLIIQLFYDVGGCLPSFDSSYWVSVSFRDLIHVSIKFPTDMREQQRFRQACASSQSYQGLYCSLSKWHADSWRKDCVNAQVEQNIHKSCFSCVIALQYKGLLDAEPVRATWILFCSFLIPSKDTGKWCWLMKEHLSYFIPNYCLKLICQEVYSL